MRTCRPVAVLACCSVFLTGCLAGGDSGVARAPQMRDAQWIGFLPIDEVLNGNSVDLAASNAQVRAMQVRVARLQYRAQLLRAPVEVAQERLHALNSGKTPDS